MKKTTLSVVSATAMLGLSPMFSTAYAFGSYEMECIGEVRSVGARANTGFGSAIQGPRADIKCKGDIYGGGGYSASPQENGNTLECESTNATQIDIATQALVNNREIKLIAEHTYQGYQCRLVKVFPNCPDCD